MTIHLKGRQRMIAGIFLLGLGACSSGKKEEADLQADAPIAVTVSKPSGSGLQGIHISGQVEASQSANISTRVMGYITAVRVKVGDHVHRGQLLATISNDDILAKKAQADAMIAEAQAALNNAQKDLDRFTVLYKQQSATAKELDNVTLQYNSAKSRLEAAMQMRNEVNANLGYTSLVAPFDGVVTQKLADAGSMANPGMPILVVEQSGSYRVSALVPEIYINKIHLGAEALISIKSIDRDIRANVSQISPSSQFTGGQYIIKANIPDAEKNGLYAGMYANLTLPVKDTTTKGSSGNAVLVPMTSIEYKDQLTGIYTISSHNTALLRWIRLGKTYDSQVEVLSGLEKDEQFIESAEGKLYNGAPVKIK